MSIRFEGIHHVSLNVDDVIEAQAFYVDLLGMELLDRPDLGFPGLWLGAGAQEVHLLEIEAGKRIKEQHFAFLVDDVDEVIAHLGANNVKCSKPSTIAGVCVQAFAHDPSGNMIEFNQRLAQPSAAEPLV